MQGVQEIWGENDSHYSESMMTYPPRRTRDSEQADILLLLTLPTTPTNWLNSSFKKSWDNGMLDVPFPQRVCQVILYKCITQEKESIYILICLSLRKSTVLSIDFAYIWWGRTIIPLYWDVPAPSSHWLPTVPCSHCHYTL